MGAEADIDDVGPADYVDRLIGMLRDIVLARAIVLDKNVIDGMFEYLCMQIYIKSRKSAYSKVGTDILNCLAD